MSTYRKETKDRQLSNAASLERRRVYVCIFMLPFPFIICGRPPASGFDGRRRKGRQKEFTSFLFLYYTHYSLKIYGGSYSRVRPSPKQQHHLSSALQEPTPACVRTPVPLGPAIRTPTSAILPMVSKVGWRGHPADLFSKFSVLLGVRLPPPLLCQQLFLFCLAWKRPRKKLFLMFPHRILH
jgi:hypothetical protein